MKKMLSFILMVLAFLAFNAKDVNAGSHTAALKGFDVDGWSYYSDVTESTVSASGYGSYWMWSALYYMYDSQYDVMYYAVLVQSSIYTNTTITWQTSYSTQLHNVTFLTSDENYIDIIGYIPEQSTGSYAISYSIGDSSVGFTLSDEYDEIELLITEYSLGNCVEFNYHFTRYAENQNYSPYKGTYNQKTVVFLEVDNYSDVWLQEDLDVSIYFTGSIFRDGFLWDNDTHSELRGRSYSLEPIGIL